MTLEELRQRITAIDRQMLELVAERQALSSEVAKVKRATGRATRDFNREREVLLHARNDAASLGVSPAFAESLMRMLIRSSLTTQEQQQVAAHGQGGGRSALVIGGFGKMGHWFVDFLGSQGYRVAISDPGPAPAGVAAGFESIGDWRGQPLDYDLIVVATPLKIADAVLVELAALKPSGIVFDIGSLKTPLRAGITALREAGCRVTSVHPMFGPDTELLSGRHVIFIDAGSPEALEAVQGLFASTMAERVVMGLDEHDRLIAFVLGLSHALNIAFFTALADSGEAAPRLARLSSTTFDAQIDVASKVAQESPDLYFEIQSLNDYGAESLEALRRAVDRVAQAVMNKDASEFVGLMQRGREYLAERPRER
jgi:chorismate mutase/prephenate dehydrogenase